MPPRKRLGQLLTELGVVDEHQLQSALGHQKQWGGKLGTILVQKGFCKEDDVVGALSRHLGMPRVRLSELQVDPRAPKFVSRAIAEKLHVFAYEVSGSGRSEVVTIAMSDPTDLSAVDQLAFHTGKRIKPMLAGDSEIVAAIAEHYGMDDRPRAADGHPPAAATSTNPSQKPVAASIATPFTGVQPVAAAAAPTPAAGNAPFPRRIEPGPAPVLNRTRPGTYVPPPIPTMTPQAGPEPKLEEIEPDEPLVAPLPPPPPVPMDLPEESEDDGPMEMEPIAAHTQVDEVAGQAEFSDSGSATDAVEGFVAPNADEAAEAGAGWDAGASWDASAAPSDAPPADWGAAPAAAEGWSNDGAQSSWSAEAPAEAEAEAEQPAWAAETTDEHALPGWHEAPAPGEAPADSTGEQLPMDAIIGTAEEVYEEQPSAEQQWQGEEQLPEEQSEEQAAEAEAPQEEQPAAEGLAAAAEASEAASEALEGAHPEAAHEEAQPADAHAESEAPDAWASSEDPLASAAAPQWGTLDETANPGVYGSAEAETPADEEQHAEAAAHEALPHDTDEHAPVSPDDDAHAEEGHEAEAAHEAPAVADHTVETSPIAFEAAAAQAEEVEHVEEVAAAQEEAAAETIAAASSEEHAAEEAPVDHEPPAAEFEAHVAGDEPHAPAPDVAAAEEAHEAAEETVAEADVPVEWTDDAPAAEDGTLLEGWVAPPPTPEPQGAGWLGEALSASEPLSDRDLQTLASAGVNANDGVGALRLLASLLRHLARRQLIDVNELATEIGESRPPAVEDNEGGDPIAT
jgi:hypothetical protein